MKDFLQIGQDIANTRDRLLKHPMYYKLKKPSHIRTFMEHHVFAVWDFMSLLKALQRELTCVSVPWFPKGDHKVRHMINEIVLGEETDEAHDGKSHFEWYLEAMTQAGANVQPIQNFLELAQTQDIDHALTHASLPAGVRQFVKFTFDTISSGKIHCIAAAFTTGRENLIPGMFPVLVSQTQKPSLGSFSILVDYLERHIEVDGDDHGPLAEQMLDLLCAYDPKRIAEAKQTALAALQARDALWNGVLDALSQPIERIAS